MVCPLQNPAIFMVLDGHITFMFMIAALAVLV